MLSSSILKLASFLVMLSFCVLSSACAKNADGGWTMNVQTIAQAMKSGKMVVNEPDSMPGDNRKMDIPAVPAGQIRLYGNFKNNGDHYYCDGIDAMAYMRGAAMGGQCQFGAACNDGGWFYADIDPAAGSITAAQAYFFGIGPRHAYFFGDFRKKFKDSYVKKDSFAIGLVGETGYESTYNAGMGDQGEPAPEWPNWQNGNELLVIRGKGNLLQGGAGSTFKFDCYVGLKSLDEKIGKKIDCDISMMATGVARIQRGQ